jgi:serine protease Do
VRLTALTDEWRAKLRLTEDAEGVIVDGVIPNSSAAALGLERGDLLTLINLMDVSTPRQAQEAFLRNKQQGKAMIRVHRGGRTATRTLEASK